jgi:hypothetical protein
MSTAGRQRSLRQMTICLALSQGDRTSLFYLARSLIKLQSMFGIFPEIKGKGVCVCVHLCPLSFCVCMVLKIGWHLRSGAAAKLVCDMLIRMRKVRERQWDGGNEGMNDEAGVGDGRRRSGAGARVRPADHHRSRGTSLHRTTPYDTIRYDTIRYDVMMARDRSIWLRRYARN